MKKQQIELSRHVRGWWESKARAYLEIQPLAQTGDGSIDIHMAIKDAPKDGLLEADCILTLAELKQIGAAIAGILNMIRKGQIRELPRYEYCKGCNYADFGNEICSYPHECTAYNPVGRSEEDAA